MNAFNDEKWKSFQFATLLRESFKEVLKEKCSPQQLVYQNMDWEIKTNPAIVDAQMTVEELFEKAYTIQNAENCTPWALSKVKHLKKILEKYLEKKEI